MAMPRTVEITGVGKRIFATTFDEPLPENQRAFFENEERRLLRFHRWGIETREGGLSWQMAVLCVLLGGGWGLVVPLRNLLALVMP